MRSRNIFGKLPLLVLLYSFLVGCGGKVDEGEFENGTYSNNYFRFSMEVPDEWKVLDDDDLSSLLGVTQSVIGETLDEDIKKHYHILFFGGDYPSQEGFLYSLLITAQDIAGNRELSDPYEYLQNTSYLELERLYGDGLLSEPVFKKEMGKREFYCKTYAISTKTGDSFSQTIVVAKIKKHLLSFILTYDTEEQYQFLMEKVLSDIRFR